MKARFAASATAACPCGTARTYDLCCGRYHSGEAAPDAEALMRSRYSAYVLGNEAYLIATWHRTTRPEQLDLAAGPRTKWLGLEVRRHMATDEENAIVEFVARFKVGWRAQRLHEISRFVREGGRWFYVDGLAAYAPRLSDESPGARSCQRRRKGGNHDACDHVHRLHIRR